MPFPRKGRRALSAHQAQTKLSWRRSARWVSAKQRRHHQPNTAKRGSSKGAPAATLDLSKASWVVAVAPTSDWISRWSSRPAAGSRPHSAARTLARMASCSFRQGRAACGGGPDGPALPDAARDALTFAGRDEGTASRSHKGTRLSFVALTGRSSYPCARTTEPEQDHSLAFGRPLPFPVADDCVYGSVLL